MNDASLYMVVANDTDIHHGLRVYIIPTPIPMHVSTTQEFGIRVQECCAFAKPVIIEAGGASAKGDLTPNKVKTGPNRGQQTGNSA